mmetsp:Transcript_69101/g.202328  ORF Transcript_69101/g.202328 Transcript_69101/m.202328 type:complete len:216 (+) Transcript_69101:920-1567(+)
MGTSQHVDVQRQGIRKNRPHVLRLQCSLVHQIEVCIKGVVQVVEDPWHHGQPLLLAHLDEERQLRVRHRSWGGVLFRPGRQPFQCHGDREVQGLGQVLGPHADRGRPGAVAEERLGGVAGGVVGALVSTDSHGTQVLLPVDLQWIVRASSLPRSLQQADGVILRSRPAPGGAGPQEAEEQRGQEGGWQRHRPLAWPSQAARSGVRWRGREAMDRA